MQVYSGSLWRDASFHEGWVAVEDGRIVSTGTGAPPGRPTARGVLLPSLVNAHTHAGDFLARGRIPPGMGLAEAVEPPHGLKYRLLRAATEGERRASLEASCREARAHGTRVIYDFREQGAAGSRMLKEAARAAGIEAVALGAPEGRETAPEDEVLGILAHADGLGLSAVRDVTPEAALAHAAIARRAGKRFALHWSEGVREPLEPALALRPDFLVHAVQATPADLERLSDARIPLVTCPRANARLVDRVADVRAWLDAGLDVCIGTDNAMLQTLDVLEELRFARERLRGVRPEELLAMAVDAPRRRLAPPGAMAAWAPGEPADFIVLRDLGDPWASVLSPDATVLASAWTAARA